MKRTKRTTLLGLGLVAAAVLVGCQAKEQPKKQPPPSFNPQALAVEARAQDIAAGIQRYKLDVGQYPQTLHELFASDAKGWKGPYLGSGPPAVPMTTTVNAESLLTDLWGEPFEYAADKEPRQVVSRGPDKQRGTGDDIVVTVDAAGSP